MVRVEKITFAQAGFGAWAGERLRAATQEVTQEQVMPELQFSLSLWRACGWTGRGGGGPLRGAAKGSVVTALGVFGPCRAPLDFLT